jgi:hypothetical protein
MPGLLRCNLAMILEMILTSTMSDVVLHANVGLIWGCVFTFRKLVAHDFARIFMLTSLISQVLSMQKHVVLILAQRKRTSKNVPIEIHYSQISFPFPVPVPAEATRARRRRRRRIEAHVCKELAQEVCSNYRNANGSFRLRAWYTSSRSIFWLGVWSFLVYYYAFILRSD